MLAAAIGCVKSLDDVAYSKIKSVAVTNGSGVAASQNRELLGAYVKACHSLRAYEIECAVMVARHEAHIVAE